MINIHIRRPARFIEYPVAKDTDFEKGDLMWYDTTNHVVKPMADFTWDTSEEVTRRNAIPYFVGVAEEARTGKEGHASSMIVPSGCIFEMAMTSGTPVIGTLLGFEKNASANSLLSTTLQIVTDIADAIGFCVKYYTAATTTVECMLFSPYDVEGGLASRVHNLTFPVPVGLWTTGAGNVVTNFAFKKRVKLLSVWTVEQVAATGDTVFTLKNGANSLDDTHTATATALGTYLRTTISDANNYDLFAHDDAMDIASGAQATAGSGMIGIEYMDVPVIG